ncbi:MAG: hypothetical protein JWL64_554 [Frankiales bacterium]|nr:hypothetical protein [Frankiales bacterium]
MVRIQVRWTGRMMVDARRRRWTVAVLAAVTAMLSGCASSSRTHGTGMMGGDAPYHFSRLSCAAPGSLPGVTSASPWPTWA